MKNTFPLDLIVRIPTEVIKEGLSRFLRQSNKFLRMLPECYEERENIKDLRDHLHKLIYNTHILCPRDKKYRDEVICVLYAEQYMKATALTGAYPVKYETTILV